MSTINPIKFVNYVDFATDIVPVVSNVKNLIILFLKSVYKCLPTSMTLNSRFWERIETTNLEYCLVLTFVPVLSNLLPIYSLVLTSVQAVSDLLNTEVVRKKMEEEKINVFRQAIVTAVIIDDGAKIDQLLSDKDHPSLEFTHGSEGWTPLNGACSLGKFEAVKALVEHGASVDTADITGATPMSNAQRLEDPSIYNYLQQKLTEREKSA